MHSTHASDSKALAKLLLSACKSLTLNSKLASEQHCNLIMLLLGVDKIIHALRQPDHLKYNGASPVSATFTWMDSTGVLNWFKWNPRGFNTFMGTVSRREWKWFHLINSGTYQDLSILQIVPLGGSTLLTWPSTTCWDGPESLSGLETDWPSAPLLDMSPVPSEEKEVLSDTGVAQLLSNFPCLMGYLIIIS